MANGFTLEELDDFYAPVVGFAIEMVEQGRMVDADRPEDRLAMKLKEEGAADLSDAELDILEERLDPLTALYWELDRTAFEIEFAKRRAAAFYGDPPAAECN